MNDSSTPPASSDHATETRPDGARLQPAKARARLEDSIRNLLEAVGEDPDREGLRETPERVARLYLDLFSGLYEDPRRHLEKQFSTDGHSGPVIVKDIPFQSTCEHHLLPVRGKAAVAYLPDGGRLTGLSKLARLVEGYARRPQLQERLTDQIVAALVEVLRPRAVLVMLEAEHMCMTLRGVRAPGSLTVTLGAHGLWAEDLAARGEILGLMKS
ncbi:GTP cyclohydrolase I FolE [Oecophyllibacter saccharovorans]|uniref:GTP cyclohydrolase 1 n=1 Tax=Oecophyllibacter saccharovorans TaxID=2558360 RepID=A0A506UKI4_9PROT|nr:GTP cyclohydrolase I FolE [Oecophyllibacter saccharovorans]TPW33849.1 GTP cyclohydrolase I FolE [Oecophyllibacter saccharovorans]